MGDLFLLFQHLNRIEEQVLESLAWAAVSALQMTVHGTSMDAFWSVTKALSKCERCQCINK